MENNIKNIPSPNILFSGSQVTNPTYSLSNSGNITISGNLYSGDILKGVIINSKLYIGLESSIPNNVYVQLLDNDNQQIVDISHITTINGHNYMFFDISKYLACKINGNINLKIINLSDTAIDVNTTYSSYIPYISTDYQLAFYDIDNQDYLSKKMSSTSSFVYNPLYKTLFIYRTIASSLTNFDISINYSSFQQNENFLFFPKGIRINLLEQIIVDDGTITYIDERSFVHRFQRVALSSGYIFYDQSGSGLLIQEYNGQYKMFSEDRLGYKLFSNDGLLIAIYDNHSILVLSISYSTTSILIDDQRGNTVTISHLSSISSIAISFASVTYSITYDSNLLPETIKCSDNSSASSYDSFSFNNVTLISFTPGFNDGYYFSYDDSVVSSISEYTSSGSLRDSYSFIYDYLSFLTTNYHNVTVTSSFNSECRLINKTEVKEDNSCGIIFQSEEELNDFKLYINNPVCLSVSGGTVTTHGTYIYQAATSDFFSSDKKYIVHGFISKTGLSLPTNTHNLSVRLKINGNVVGQTSINTLTNLTQLFSFVFVSPSDNPTLLFELVNDFDTYFDYLITVKLVGFTIHKYIGHQSSLAVNNQEIGTYLNGTLDGVQRTFYKEDIISNYLNTIVNSRGNNFLWSNRKKLLSSLPSSFSYNLNGNYYSLSQLFIIRVDDGNEVIYHSLTYLSNQYFLKTYKVISGNEFTLIFDTFNSYLEKIQTYNYKNDFVSSVFSNGLMTSQTVGNNSTSLFFKEVYSYDTYKRLISKSSLLAGNTSTVSYSYSENTLLINKETDPLNNEKNIGYNSNKTRKTSISIDNATNHITYTNGRVYKYYNNAYYSHTYSQYLLSSIKIRISSSTYYSIASYSYTFNSTGNSINITYGDYQNKITRNKYDRIQYVYDVNSSGNVLKVSYIYLDNKPSDYSSITAQDINALSINNKLYKIIDNYNSSEHRFSYNDHGNVDEYIYLLNSSQLLTISYVYDTYQRPTSIVTTSYLINSVEEKSIYYKDNHSNDVDYITSKTYPINSSSNYLLFKSYLNKDYLSRTSDVVDGLLVGGSLQATKTSFLYQSVNNQTSSLPIRLDYYFSLSIYKESEHITYDSKGFITSLIPGNQTSTYSNQGRRYTYDSIGRLISEIDLSSPKEYVYEYDYYGNIQSVKLYALSSSMSRVTLLSTKTYSYHSYFKHRLISYNGTSISYDNAYNPTSYGNITYTWTRGRLLSSYYNSSTGLNVNYTYNYRGIRTRKEITNGDIHDYIYLNDKLVEEKITTSSNVVINLKYLYGTNGIYGVIKDNSDVYIFQKNIFNDIIRIYQNGTTLVAQYKYDAFGEHTVKDGNGNSITSEYHIGKLNPFRYRSYYYDKETSLYYCLSRYYFPAWKRWLNLDDINYLDVSEIDGLNLFAYCNNNPIMYSDETGHLGILASALIGAFLGFTLSGAFEMGKQLIISKGNLDSLDFASVLRQAIIGGSLGFVGFAGGAALGGLLVGTAAVSGAEVGIWFGVSSAVAFAGGVGAYTVETFGHGSDWDWGEAIGSGFTGMAAGMMAYGAGAMSKLVQGSDWVTSHILRPGVKFVFSFPLKYMEGTLINYLS